MKQMLKVAVLDDYQQVALAMADWSPLNEQAEIVVFKDHLDDPEDIIRRLTPFQAVCVMRERTPLTRHILTHLPNLKLIVSTGYRNASIDADAAAAAGITIKHTGYHWSGAPEHTWALLMAIARKIPQENTNLISGNWQTTVGSDLAGKTIGIVGLGNIGQKIARYAAAFDMNVVAWSPNLTEAKAREGGARLVSKETLFRDADFITVHMVLSSRSEGIINRQDLELMKPSAYLINTSRGPLINERDLVEVLEQNMIAGAALDVFDREPLPVDHPFRKLKNVLATPHIGYVTEDTYRIFYTDTVREIEAWIGQH